MSNLNGDNQPLIGRAKSNRDSLLIEPLKRTACAASVKVRVGAFPVLEVEGGLGEEIKRVLRLGLLNGLVIIIVIPGAVISSVQFLRYCCRL